MHDETSIAVYRYGDRLRSLAAFAGKNDIDRVGVSEGYCAQNSCLVRRSCRWEISDRLLSLRTAAHLNN